MFFIFSNHHFNCRTTGTGKLAFFLSILALTSSRLWRVSKKLRALSLSDLAEYFFLSKEHLSRLFKKETGQNLFSYIMKLKLTEAKQLLKTTDMTLDDIAFHLGFSNGNYFSKVLKKNVDFRPASTGITETCKILPNVSALKRLRIPILDTKSFYVQSSFSFYSSHPGH